MKYSHFIEQLSDKKHTTHILLVVVAFLTVLTIAMMCFAHSLSKRQTVILVPMQLAHAASVGNTTVSKNYLTNVALALVTLRMDVTPQTVDTQFTWLQRYIAPADYVALRGQLQHESALIKKRHLTSSFSLQQVAVDTHRLHVQLSGILSRTVGDLVLPPTATTFDIHFVNNNGLLKAVSFVEVKKR